MSDQSKLPDGTCAWILLSGKIGHEVNCLGVAHELGLAPQMRRVHARSFFEFFAPWGPIDPRDNPQNPESPLYGPLPDIVFSSGRTTVPVSAQVRLI
jgi:hypothetical protein